jgi:hypothetical protein
LRTVVGDGSTFYLRRLQSWTRTAQQAANSQSNVMTGTITETAANQYSYSATPTDRLEVVRLTGYRFSFTVSSISGSLTSTSFPSRSESISFTWRLPEGIVNGTIAGLSVSLVGTGFLRDADTATSTFNLSSTTTYNGFYDAQNARSYVDRANSDRGTIQNTSRNVSFAIDIQVIGCVGLTCTPGGLFTERAIDVTTTVGGNTYRLDYQYDSTNPSVGLQTVAFSGLVWSGGQQVGVLQRTNIAGTSYSLDMVLGQSRFVTEVVQSAQ